jgi:2-oxoglutarate dehydrogenase E2 component (dihydrolipoamide succinyltransferase)
MEADMKLVSNHLKINKELFSRQGIRLTYSSYFVAATALALRAYPLVNSSWTENGILVKNAINIGLATSLEEEGLIVPVIKNADGYSISGLARVIGDLVNRARSHQLKPDDVTDGTFSITNHGTAGSLFATPVINQPQAGILGVGAIKKRVVVINDAIAIRPMVYLSFTFDHRILDGSTADNFLAKIVSVLENWQ